MNDECVDVDSIDGVFKLDTRGGARFAVPSSPSSSSVMTASCLEDGGIATPGDSSLTVCLGLGEYDEY